MVNIFTLLRRSGVGDGGSDSDKHRLMPLNWPDIFSCNVWICSEFHSLARFAIQPWSCAPEARGSLLPWCVLGLSWTGRTRCWSAGFILLILSYYLLFIYFCVPNYKPWVHLFWWDFCVNDRFLFNPATEVVTFRLRGYYYMLIYQFFGVFFKSIYYLECREVCMCLCVQN